MSFLSVVNVLLKYVVENLVESDGKCHLPNGLDKTQYEYLVILKSLEYIILTFLKDNKTMKEF